MTTLAVATVGTIRTPGRARTILVLNASYEPLRPVHLKRAMSLLVRGRAVVHEDDGTGRYLTNAGRDLLFPWPKVLRLTRYVKVSYARLTAPGWSKHGVLARDGFICAYCREPGASTVDHVVPVSRGGHPRSWLNTVAACQPCNGRKADRTPHEAGMPLLATPYVPRARR